MEASITGRNKRVNEGNFDKAVLKAFLSEQDNKVSVIIVNWNDKEFLERCLTALMAQTATPYEIILVDNASTDGSLEIARRFPSVRLLAQNSNTGFARGNNLAINAAAAGSEWIALLNPDAFPEPRWLEECLLSAQRHGLGSEIGDFNRVGPEIPPALRQRLLGHIGRLNRNLNAAGRCAIHRGCPFCMNL